MLLECFPTNNLMPLDSSHLLPWWLQVPLVC
jgi:hypothetical protein